MAESSVLVWLLVGACLLEARAQLFDRISPKFDVKLPGRMI
jgi:hypothetical protein